MEAGKLKRRITFQQNISPRDSYGSVQGWQEGRDAGTWSDVFASVPADIQPAKGMLKNAPGELQAVDTHVITIRFANTQPPLAANMRIFYRDPVLQKDRFFIITSVTNVDEDNWTMEINAMELV